MDLRSLQVENQTKVHDFLLHVEQIWRTQYHACNDRLNLRSSHFTADNGMRNGVNRSLCMELCTPKAIKFYQSGCNNLSCTFFWFSIRNYLNISIRCQCVSLKKSQKISDQIYISLFFSRRLTYTPG